MISSMNNSIANQVNNNSFLYNNHQRTKTQNNNPEDRNIKLRITQNNVKPLSTQPYLNQQGRL